MTADGNPKVERLFSGSHEWRPRLREFNAELLVDASRSEHDIAVLFWAVWDRSGIKVDEAIAAITPDLSGLLSFYCCDVDDPKNLEWLTQIRLLNTPVIGVFRNGVLLRYMYGIRDAQHLKDELANTPGE
jgi:hypothetical protein